MLLAKLTKSVVAVSALLVAVPALAAPVVDQLQSPLTTNQSLSAVGITGPGSTTIINGSHYTSFDGTYDVSGLAKNTSFSGIDLGIVTHAGGWLEVTVDEFTKGSAGLKSLTGTIDGTAITFTQVGTTSEYSGSALVKIANGVNTNNLVFSGLTGSKVASFSGSYTFVATTPEPAAWMMMIMGLAFVGGMLRRQRNLVAA